MTSMARTIPYKWLVAIAVAMALFMEILDMTVLNTALPVLGEYFTAGTGELQWVVTAYLISLAVVIPASGWVADRFGDKRTFVAALTLYTAASLWAGLAGSVGELVLARVVQGIGGGLILPVGTAMLFRAFRPDERARASAVLAIPTTLAPALGPVLGGWLADEVSWRWIFFLKLPVAVIAVLYSMLMLKPGEPRAAGRFDFAGFVSGGAGLALMLVALERGAREGWDALSLAVVALGLALGLLFVIIERRSRAPMIDLGLFADRMFRLGNALLLPAAGLMMGTLFLVPLFVQTQFGLNATQSGLVTICLAATHAAGRVCARHGQPGHSGRGRLTPEPAVDRAGDGTAGRRGCDQHRPAQRGDLRRDLAGRYRAGICHLLHRPPAGRGRVGGSDGNIAGRQYRYPSPRPRCRCRGGSPRRGRCQRFPRRLLGQRGNRRRRLAAHPAGA